MPTLAPPTITEVEQKIGEYCASLVQDGDTIQLGIGGIPDAVVTFLKDKKDLGLHTEMAADGIIDLIEAGVINKRKHCTAAKALRPSRQARRDCMIFWIITPALSCMGWSMSITPM